MQILSTIGYAAIGLALYIAGANADDAPGCENAGDHMCAAIVYGGAFESGIGGVGDSTAGATVYDGSCHSITKGGSLEPQGTDQGFKGDFQTSYGSTVTITAASVGDGDIGGVTVYYYDQTITQDQCRSGQTGFDPSYSYVQCNFSC